MDSFVRRYDQIDINVVSGFATTTNTPVIKDIGSKGLQTIADETASFEDSIAADVKGTFTVYNLGLYGVKSAAPIVLPPQACSLALGAIVDTLVPKEASEGQNDWKVSPILCATLSCDHRVIDGAVGAQWLASFKTLVENPTMMLL